MTLAAHAVRWLAGRKVIVDDISVSVEPGQTLGLIGPNGSGKSSLIRLLAGLRPPASGEVSLDA